MNKGFDRALKLVCDKVCEKSELAMSLEVKKEYLNS